MPTRKRILTAKGKWCLGNDEPANLSIMLPVHYRPTLARIERKSFLADCSINFFDIIGQKDCRESRSRCWAMHFSRCSPKIMLKTNGLSEEW